MLRLRFTSLCEEAAIQGNVRHFHGAETDSQGPGTRPSKVSAITNMPRPEDKAGVQRFLGMCQYLSKFRPNLSTSVLPLGELTKQDAAFIWSNMHESAFHAAKELISKATALRYYDPSLPVTLQVDAIDRTSPTAGSACMFYLAHFQ